MQQSNKRSCCTVDFFRRADNKSTDIEREGEDFRFLLDFNKINSVGGGWLVFFSKSFKSSEGTLENMPFL